MTLVELMLALLLALLLTHVLLQVYLANQHSKSLRLALLSTQKNAMSAITILTTAIEKAGYLGCVKLTDDFPIFSSLPSPLTMKNKLIVTANNGITVRHASDTGVLLQNKITDGRTLWVSKELAFAAGDIVIISDCKRAEIVVIENSMAYRERQKIILQQRLHFQFQPYAEISRLEINRYFIGDSKRKNNQGSATQALFIENAKGRKIELVEGIKALKIIPTVYKAGKLIDVPAEKVAEDEVIAGIMLEVSLAMPPVIHPWYAYVAL